MKFLKDGTSITEKTREFLIHYIESIRRMPPLASDEQNAVPAHFVGGLDFVGGLPHQQKPRVEGELSLMLAWLEVLAQTLNKENAYERVNVPPPRANGANGESGAQSAYGRGGDRQGEAVDEGNH